MELTKKIQEFENRNYRGLKEFNRGIERECLRVKNNGELSTSPHPHFLGSALTNPYITTDFSESQLEFITPYYLKTEETLSDLADIHLFFYSKDSDELLWPSSMPCYLDANSEIPIAQYGNSNLGKLKNIYRIGLKHRYGDRMQAISGLHYNFSFVEELWHELLRMEGSTENQRDFISRNYFSLMRNFNRYGWILLYFYGATPFLDESFGSSSKKLLKFDHQGTLYLPHATSLRMSDLGYHNKEQKELAFCFNSLESYIEKIEMALSTKDPQWEKIGVKINGSYQQLSDKILQIENEFYGFIRPKRYNKLKNIRPNKILKEEGVQYLEIRVMDINPFSPIGITYDQTKFLDVFLVYCLLQESPLCNLEEMKTWKSNWLGVAMQGRDPDLKLKTPSGEKLIKDWAMEIYHGLKEVAIALDKAQQTNDFSQVVEDFYRSIDDSSQTLAGKLTIFLKDKSFLNFHLERAVTYKKEFLNRRLAQKSLEKFSGLVKKSLFDQEILEQDHQNFDEYLINYLIN